MSTQMVQVFVLLLLYGLCPGSEGCDTSAFPSSYLLTVHNNDDDVTLLLSLNAAPGGSSHGEDCDGVDRGVTHACLSPLGHKRLKIILKPRGVCFKL